MQNGGEETLTFALSLYYSFPFWFDAIKTQQQPHEKLCSHVSLLHRNFHSSIDRNFVSTNLIFSKQKLKHNPSFPFRTKTNQKRLQLV